MTDNHKRQPHFESLEERALLAADLGVSPETVVPDAYEEELIVETAPVDGYGNNLENPEYGATDTQLLRLTTVEYEDGYYEPAGADRPSAREVSNEVVAQTESVTNDRYLTDITWLWGQFIDHDIDLTESADPAEPFPIEVPEGDPYFDPDGTGTETIDVNRSVYDAETGDSIDDPRQQINQITAFLDGSVVYGSDQERADALRTFEGGQLKTSEGDLLPFNEEGLENAGGTSDALFLAGDVRANENAALTSMHTLWVREHNRIAEEIAAEDPTLSDEEIYQQARSLVTAEIQAITYNEFLPALLGVETISDYEGYDAEVDPDISNVFSTAAYRFGHSMLSSELLRLNNDGTVIEYGNLDLQNAFFAPDEIIDNGIDSLLLGAASQQAQEIDTMVVDDVRNFLFGEPGSGGFDLPSLNIQRGRDHGLADYNQTRVDFGLDPVESFSDITSDPELAAKLEEVYGDVNNIDVWVGALAEDHVAGASVGELTQTILTDQFERIRDGDRFWYENIFDGEQLEQIENTSLSNVIMRNTDVTDLQENVFFDKSVLYYEVDAGQQQQNISVVARDGGMDIVDNHTQEVLETQSLDGLERVMVVGSSTSRDRFTLDVAGLESSLPGGIVVYGGSGGGDRLTVNGTRSSDQIVVDGYEITANDQVIEQSGFEFIRVAPGRGRDDVQVVENGDAHVTVSGQERYARGNHRGERHDSGHRSHRDSAPQPVHQMLDTLADAVERIQGRQRAGQQDADGSDTATTFDEIAALAASRIPTAFGTELASTIERMAREIAARSNSRSG